MQTVPFSLTKSITPLPQPANLKTVPDVFVGNVLPENRRVSSSSPVAVSVPLFGLMMGRLKFILTIFSAGAAMALPFWACKSSSGLGCPNTDENAYTVIKVIINKDLPEIRKTVLSLNENIWEKTLKEKIDSRTEPDHEALSQQYDAVICKIQNILKQIKPAKNGDWGIQFVANEMVKLFIVLVHFADRSNGTLDLVSNAWNSFQEYYPEDFKTKFSQYLSAKEQLNKIDIDEPQGNIKSIVWQVKSSESQVIIEILLNDDRAIQNLSPAQRQLFNDYLYFVKKEEGPSLGFELYSDYFKKKLNFTELTKPSLTEQESYVQRHNWIWDAYVPYKQLFYTDASPPYNEIKLFMESPAYTPNIAVLNWYLTGLKPSK